MKMIRIINIFFALLLFPLFTNAADIPTQVIGSEEFDYAMCIEHYKDDCVSSICLTSSDLDCSQKCKQGAEDKCEEQADD